jgi:ribosomal protein S18 acetylase RimI-like enzyme
MDFMDQKVRLLCATEADVDILRRLATDDVDFDIEGRGGDRTPLAPDEALAYLGDPTVLHWVAEDPTSGSVLGHLQCQLVRKRYGNPVELLLYEIGVLASARRRGVGRALAQAMIDWMKAHEVGEVWVLSDNPDATLFYEACGFRRAPEQPVYLTRELS